MDGRPRKMREGNVRIVPPPAMAFMTPAPKEAATRINAWVRFMEGSSGPGGCGRPVRGRISEKVASDRLDQPGRGLGGIPVAEDFLPAIAAVDDHLAQGVDDP